MTKRIPMLTLTAFALALAGCEDEPEETSSGASAINLDEVPVVEPVPEADDRASGSADDSSAIRDNHELGSMESGSNADGGRRIDPESSKLLPAR